MKIKKRVLPAVVAAILSAASLGAQATQFSNVVIFGDSLSDAGYFRSFLASQGFPAAQMGRFSTNPDPVWSELISQFYGFQGRPSNAGGSIYAQGGARVTLTPGVSTPPGQPERPVSTQITEYLTAHGGTADPNALYGVWAGANDFFTQFTGLLTGQITSAQLQTNLLAAAGTEVQQVGRLYAGRRQVRACVRRIRCAMTPGNLALDAATRRAITQLTVGYNTTLWNGLLSSGLRARRSTSSRSSTRSARILRLRLRQHHGCRLRRNSRGAPNTRPSSCLQGVNTTPTCEHLHVRRLDRSPDRAAHRIVAQFAESAHRGTVQLLDARRSAAAHAPVAHHGSSPMGSRTAATQSSAAFTPSPAAARVSST
jgi:hypothetical protein